MADTNGAVVDKAVIQASVTADETRLAKQTSMWLGSFMRPEPLIALQPDLPAVLNYWNVRTRDAALYSTLDYEDKWANAVSIAATKCASLEYDVEGDVDLRKTRSHDILANVDGMQGWTPFISKHIQDFMCTDNGAFIEIVRASSAIGSRILGLLHLDSSRCVRTGDPQIPVLYTDRLGKVHPMKAHEVIALCDMPNPRATFNGSGRCAARRVYRTIYRMAVIEAYVAEKVSGQRPLTWYLMNGITQKQIDNSLQAARLEADARNLTSFMGAAVTSVVSTEPISLVEVPFSSLPDGFDLEAERSNARLEYANAIGLDIQDLQPGAIGGSLGSSTQSEVLNEKSKGKGLAYWRKAFTEQMNLKVLPDSTTFLFVEKDYRDDVMAAQAQKARIDNLTAMKGAGMIDADTAVKIAIDAGDLPADTVAPEPEPVPVMGADGKVVMPKKGDAQGETPNVLGSGEKPDDESKKAWDESAHPRRGAGDDKGGEFAPKDETSVEAWAKKKFSDPQAAENFVRWFEGSQVVDKDGNPLTVYHGTSAAFEAFDPEKADKEGLYGPGLYFTENPEVATGTGGALDEAGVRAQSRAARAGYAWGGLDKEGGVPQSYPVHLRIKQPFDIEGTYDKSDAEWLHIAADEALGPRRESTASATAGMSSTTKLDGQDIYDWLSIRVGGNKANANKILQKAGYDGITHIGGNIVGHVRHRVYIAFDPTQIKSAIGNSGAFNPDDPSMIKESNFTG